MKYYYFPLILDSKKHSLNDLDVKIIDANFKLLNLPEKVLVLGSYLEKINKQPNQIPISAHEAVIIISYRGTRITNTSFGKVLKIGISTRNTAPFLQAVMHNSLFMKLYINDLCRWSGSIENNFITARSQLILQKVD